MKNQNGSRKAIAFAFSLVFAASNLCCSTSEILTAGRKLTVAAAEVKSEEISTADQGSNETEKASSELVNIIVKVSGDAILATPEGAAQGDDFLETDQAVQLANSLENTQSYVQAQIRAFYSELKIKYSYSVLYNGFSCMIPENLIDQVKALPCVEDVIKAENMSTPKMATAPSLGGYPAYYDFTGCSGEGQVIAVIDSELDLTHPMFSALDDSIQVRLTEDDIAGIASSIGFNVNVDPAQAYRNSKIPFAVDYFDDDPINAVGDSEAYPASYHGTHVSGIAAGNQFTDGDGNTISGIAKDAQIVFMAAADDESIFPDYTVIAALEDAVKLHADVINLSLGAAGEPINRPFREAYQNAINAGITICQAAGNDGDGSILGEIHTADNPDRGMMDADIAGGLEMLAVASASNVFTQHNKCFMVGDDKVAYAETHRESDSLDHYLGDDLSGEYEYVYCGFGNSEDFAQKDLTGKIALVNCGGGSYVQEKADYAREVGAVGIIGIAFEGETLIGGIVDNDLPSGIISYEDGQNMIAEENKTLVFTEDTIDIDIPTSVVPDSSYGVHQDLELRPDIMAIGDHVESAGYNSSTSVMNGTSMATPYVSGCMAVLNEYLQKKGSELDNAEKLRYMRNLVMTSAIPYEENGMFVTPRRQGAGMISLNNVITDKVLLTGAEGESKIQLYDNLGDQFSFRLNMNNISDQDVDFSSARLVLTTDDSKFDEDLQAYVINGQQPLNSSADLSSLLHIGAGENKTETITVNMDSAQSAAIKEIFTNGFFIDGYLLLEGAENCCNISIPLVGFCGDWSQVPIFDDYHVVTTAMGAGGRPVRNNVSLAHATALVREICKSIPEEEYSSGEDISGLIFKYATDEQLNALAALETETSYSVSPNADGLADTIGLVHYSQRIYHFNGLNIYNDKGDLLYTGEDCDIKARHESFNAEPLGTLNLEEGNYTAQITGYIYYQPSMENPQKLEFQFAVDKTAPELTAELTEKAGRKILRITAKDSSLDGIYITGFKGNDKAELETLDMISSAMEIMTLEGEFITRPFSSSDLPLIGKMLTGTIQDYELNSIDFADVIAAVPDKNGVYTFEYDITDFQSYTISAMDKAYNISSVESEPVSAEQISAGIYMSDTQLFSFNGDTMKSISLKDGSAKEERYTFSNGELVCGDEVYRVYKVDEKSIRLVSSENAQTLTYYGEGTSEESPFYTTDQIEKRFQDLIINLYEGENPKTEISVHNGIATVIGYETYQGRELEVGYYKINIFTGEIVGKQAEWMPDVFPITFNDFAQDAVLMMVENDKIYYLDFNNGKKISQEDGTETNISFTANNTDLQLKLSAEDEPVVFSDYSFREEGVVSVLTVKSEDGEEHKTMTLNYVGAPDTFSFYTNDELSAMAVEYYKNQHGDYSGTPEIAACDNGFVTIQLTEEVAYAVDPTLGYGCDQAGEEVDLTSTLDPQTAEGTDDAGDPVNIKEEFVPEIPDNAFSLEKLEEMALKDYELKTGIKPDSAEAVYNRDGSVKISIFNAENESLNEYTVDPETGTGTNKDGEEVNLPQTGINNTSHMLILISAILMLGLGIIALKISGIGRRRKNDE